MLSFRSKLLLLLLFVAVTPVAFSGILSIHTSQKEVLTRIESFQQRSASLVAGSVDRFFNDSVKALQLAVQLIRFDRIPAEQLDAVLQVPYRQFDFANVVALFDQDGSQLAEPVFQARPDLHQGLEGHESVLPEEIETFGNHIQLQAALQSGVAFGPVYFNHRTSTPRLALSLAVPLKEKKRAWLMAVELSLSRLEKMVREADTGAGGMAIVVDNRGRPVHHPDRDVMAKQEPMSSLEIVARGLGQKRVTGLRYRSPDGQEWLGSFAPIPVLGWGLVIQQPVEQAFSTVRRIRSYAIFWIALSLLVAIFGAVLFSRGVSKPIRDLSDGALAIAEGRFDQKITVRSKDEIGRLAGTFNRMVESLNESFETISKKNVEIQEKNIEIESWNLELQKRVEDRTSELKQAQEQIVRSQKLAAVGELGAGAAHEINNPLAGIRGLASIMLAEFKPGEKSHDLLSEVINQTDRISTVVADLKRFSETPEGERRVPVDINNIARAALRMVEGQLEEQKVMLQDRLASGIPEVLGDYAELQQVFLHLFNNAKNAMSDGGSLALTSSEVEGGAVKLVVSDTGRGITKENLRKIFDPFFTTKDAWRGVGLGLSVAHRIIEEHHGKITVESEPGQGATFTIIFPGVGQRRHLA